MNPSVRVVTTYTQLAEAIQAPENDAIEIRGKIENVPSLQLKPGQRLYGAVESTLEFEPGHDGVVLTTNNRVENLEIRTDPDRCVLRNDADFEGFGHLTLSNLRTRGCIRLIAENLAKQGHIEAQNIHIVEANARAYGNRPFGFGVEVLPGAFTLLNRQESPNCRVSADLRGISVGRPHRPILGTGVLIGGVAGGGGMIVSLLETGDIHADGGVAPGTPDRISGGVFILEGSNVDSIRNLGSVTTYGANDMVLDNWGRVERWHAYSNVTSYGPNGIGFVNLGELGELTIDGLLETHGLGACGFNSGEVKQSAPASSTGNNNDNADKSGTESGTVREATFERVVTRGDGAIGIQISAPVGHIRVRNGVETYGGFGASLARGVVTNLAAIALSLKPGGSARELVIDGGLTTHGSGIEAIELHGQIDAIHISGAAGPRGGGFPVV